MLKEIKHKLENTYRKKGTIINDQTENIANRTAEFNSILEREEKGISKV